MVGIVRIEARGPTVAGLAAGDEDDAALVARAKADPRAFAALYRRYVDPVYRYCYRRLGNREAAEDATGLVFARALAALPGCREESFRGWLFAIAHNAIANEFRGARPERSLEGAEAVVDPAAGPEEAALAAEMLGVRVAVACHYFEADHPDVTAFLDLVARYDTTGQRQAVAPEVGETLVFDCPGGDPAALRVERDRVL